jgi:uncharacterized protein involved in outer membrane biogenesis
MADATPAQVSKPRRRWRRWVIITLLAVVGLVLISVLLTPWIVDAIVRPRIERTLSQELHARVAIERARFSWFSGLDVRGVHLTPDNEARALFSLRQISGQVGLWQLLRGRVRLQRDLVITGPEIRIERSADGSTNLQRVLDAIPQSERTDSAAGGKKSSENDGAMQLPDLSGRVRIEGLQVITVDAAGNELRAPPLDLMCEVDSLAQPIALSMRSSDGTLELAARAQVSNGRSLELERASGEASYHIDPAFSVAVRPLIMSLIPAVRESDLIFSGDGKVIFTNPSSFDGTASFSIGAERMLIAHGNTVSTVTPGMFAVTCI